MARRQPYDRDDQPIVNSLLSGCNGKIQYRDRAEAEDARDVMADKYHEPFSAYYCLMCSSYHIGRTYRSDEDRRYYEHLR